MLFRADACQFNYDRSEQIPVSTNINDMGDVKIPSYDDADHLDELISSLNAFGGAAPPNQLPISSLQSLHSFPNAAEFDEKSIPVFPSTTAGVWVDDPGSDTALDEGESPSDREIQEEAERLFVMKVDKKCTSLKRKGEHKKAMLLMEQGLASRVKLYGPESIEVVRASEQLVMQYNVVAMAALHAKKHKICLRLLRQAEDLSHTSSRLVAARVQTLNNLACCYRRMKKPKRSLALLRKSLTLLASERHVDGRAVTHLNMCAILSQLSRHDEALEHAKAAVLQCQKQLLSGSLKSKLGRRPSPEGAALLTERVAVLSIAYHNLGVEEEFINGATASLRWYRKALDLASEHLSPDAAITQTFRDSLHAAKQQQKRSQRGSQTARRAGRGLSINERRTLFANDPVRPVRKRGSKHRNRLRQSPRSHRTRPHSAGRTRTQ